MIIKLTIIGKNILISDMEKATIIHHQGFGDIFTNVSLCNYYSRNYESLVIFTTDHERKKIIDFIYKDNEKIKCIIPKFNTYDGTNTCVKCMSKGMNYGCPRDISQKCNIIDYNDYLDYDNIKIGSFNDYDEWEKFKEKSFSFSHAFYEYANLNSETRIKEFKIFRDLELEKKIFENTNLIEQKYIVTHQDRNRGFLLDENLIKNKNQYDLERKSNLFLDQIKIIESAEEIHLIDSSYSVLIYYLSFHNEKIKKIPKFLHPHPHQRDFNIYKQPIAENWFFL